MDEKDFELIRVLGETRNITRAAERIYTTQSALSKRIRAIERELGVTLMLRSRHGVVFTPEGEKVLEACRSAEKQLSSLREELLSMKTEVCGTLNAGVSLNYAQYKLPDLLAEYHRRYPKVRFHITTGRGSVLFTQFLNGSLDSVILRGEYPWDGQRFLLSEEKEYMICSKENSGRPLADYMYISHITDNEQSVQILRWMREKNLNVDGSGMCVDNITTCVEMVRRGLGWAILPEICLKNFDGDKIPCIFSNGEPFVRRTYYLSRQEAENLPQNRAFFELLKEMNHAG